VRVEGDLVEGAVGGGVRVVLGSLTARVACVVVEVG